MTEAEKRAAICAMDIYRHGRKYLLECTKGKKADLYVGLHSRKKTERDNYLEIYIVKWMVTHFEAFQKKMCDIKEKGMYQSVFAKSFLSFLEYDKYQFFNVNLAVNMLKEYCKILEDMIHASLSWEQGYESFLVEKKKQEEKFFRLLKEMENEMRGGRTG